MDMRAGDAEAKDKLWKLIHRMEVAMMTTREDDLLRSRPMWTARNESDGDLWFFTRASSHKVIEVAQHWDVNLSYADRGAQDYVSVSGVAELVRDKAKIAELWTEPMRVWFPKGLDDPDIALLRVAVTRAEYWDVPSSAMVHLYGYVKAQLTGQSPHPGDHKKLAF